MSIRHICPGFTNLAATTETTLFTVPDRHVYLAHSVRWANTTTSVVTITAWITMLVGGQAVKLQYLKKDLASLETCDEQLPAIGQVLPAGASLSAQCSVGGAVNVICNADDVTV